MADRTSFAGLTRLAPGEPLGTDGFAFQSENPSIIDQLLEVGAVSHLHDAHAALADPTLALDLSSSSGAGGIAADETIYACYTLIDQFGGETAPSDTVQVTTPPQIITPTAAPTLALDNLAGTLGVGTFLYAISLVDTAGGETPLGPSSQVQRTAGPANAEVQVSGLAAILAATGATEWRLWRSVGGGRFGWIAQGSTDTYTDDGGLLPDCTIFPPTRNTTNANNTVTVEVPAGQPAEAVQFRIYLSLDGSFSTPALAGTYAIASAGAPQVFTTIDLAAGRPPAVSRALVGAHMLDPETEIANFHWRTPVADAAALPAVGNVRGDIRLTLDDLTLHVWDDSGGGSWADVGGGGGGGGAFSSVTFTTASIATGVTTNFDLTIAPAFMLYRVEFDRATRLRLYRGAAFRTADAARAVGTPPSGDHGVIADLSATTLGSAGINPVAIGVNEDDLTSSTIKCALTNNSGITVALTFTLWFKPL